MEKLPGVQLLPRFLCQSPLKRHRFMSTVPWLGAIALQLRRHFLLSLLRQGASSFSLDLAMIMA